MERKGKGREEREGKGREDEREERGVRERPVKSVKPRARKVAILSLDISQNASLHYLVNFSTQNQTLIFHKIV